MVKRSVRTPLTVVIAIGAVGGLFAFAFLLGGNNAVLGNVSNLQLTTNFRDFNCDAWNELAVTKAGVTSVVGSGRQGFNPSFDSSLLSLTDGTSQVDFMHVRLVIQCDGNFIKNPTTVEGSMNFQLCGDPQADTTTCFAGSDRTFQQLMGVAVSTQTFFNVPIQQQSIPDDVQKVIFEGDISAFELERLFQAEDGRIFFKSVMFPNLTFRFNSPTLGIFTATYDAIKANDPIIAQYGDLRVEAEAIVDIDTDGDGFLDSVDGCINQPETVNGFQDEDGCPDEAPTTTDTDGDGIPDDVDECVSLAGTVENNGCPMLIGDPPIEPPVDTDGDGVPDESDLCIMEVGTIANAGCPEPVIMQEMEEIVQVDEFVPTVIPADIPEPLVTEPFVPPTAPTTTITSQPEPALDDRTLVILGLLIAGIVIIIVVAIVTRMRRR